jgi:invasion protein IalB
MKLIASLGAAAVAFFALTGIASAQQPTDVRRIGDFVVRCLPVENASPCDMSEEVGNKDTGQRLVTLSIAYAPPLNRYIMIISLPLGVLIEKGAVIQAAGLTTPTMPIRRCDRNGCFIEAGIDKALIDAFAKVTGAATIKMVGDDDKPYEFPLSFNGFSAAHDYMVEQNRAKAKAPSATAAAPAQ